MLAAGRKCWGGSHRALLSKPTTQRDSSAEELKIFFCICPCLMPWIFWWPLKRYAARKGNTWIGVVLQKLMPTSMAGCKFNNKLSISWTKVSICKMKLTPQQKWGECLLNLNCDSQRMFWCAICLPSTKTAWLLI